MIQRIQTLYLFIAVLFIGGFLYLKVASFAMVSDKTIEFSLISSIKQGAESKLHSFPMLLLSFGAILAVLVLLISIFSYKNRKLQVWFNLISLILIIIDTTLVVFYLFQTEKANQYTMHLNFPMVFPFAAIILIILATIAIRKDESLVRSLDRLR